MKASSSDVRFDFFRFSYSEKLTNTLLISTLVSVVFHSFMSGVMKTVLPLIWRRM